MFKRRERRSFWRRVVAFLFPQRGYRRGWLYIGRRVQRIRDTPEKIAFGFACGALASFTPLFGCHFFVAAFLAWVFRSNVVAGLLGTAVGNPITFPFIAAASMGLGTALVGGGSERADGEGVLAAFVDVFGLLWDALKTAIGIGVDQPVSWPVASARFGEFWDAIMWPYFVGGAIVGTVVSVASYMLLKPAVAAYQKRRKEKLSAKAREMLAKATKGRGPTPLKPVNKAPTT